MTTLQNTNILGIWQPLTSEEFLLCQSRTPGYSLSKAFVVGEKLSHFINIPGAATTALFSVQSNLSMKTTREWWKSGPC